jgi:hypothetical protein
MARILPLSVRYIAFRSLMKNEDLAQDSLWELPFKN